MEEGLDITSSQQDASEHRAIIPSDVAALLRQAHHDCSTIDKSAVAAGEALHQLLEVPLLQDQHAALRKLCKVDFATLPTSVCENLLRAVLRALGSTAQSNDSVAAKALEKHWKRLLELTSQLASYDEIATAELLAIIDQADAACAVASPSLDTIQAHSRALDLLIRCEPVHRLASSSGTLALRLLGCHSAIVHRVRSICFSAADADDDHVSETGSDDRADSDMKDASALDAVAATGDLSHSKAVVNALRGLNTFTTSCRDAIRLAAAKEEALAEAVWAPAASAAIDGVLSQGVRDVSAAAAMLLVSLLRAVEKDHLIGDAMRFLYTLSEDPPADLRMANSLSRLREAFRQTAFPSPACDGHVIISGLVMMRAVLSQVNTTAADSESLYSMLKTTFDSLEQAVQHSSPHVRLLALQTLLTWMGLLKSLSAQMGPEMAAEEDGSQGRIEFTESEAHSDLKNTVAAANWMERLEQVLDDNFEHPFRPVAAVVTDLYTRRFALLDSVSHSDSSEESYKALQVLLRRGASSRQSICKLQVLMPRCSPEQTLSVARELVEALLPAAHNRALWGTATGLLNALLTQCAVALRQSKSPVASASADTSKEDTVSGKKKRKKRQKQIAAGIEVKETVASPVDTDAAISAWQDLWVPGFAEAMLSDLKPVRASLCDWLGTVWKTHGSQSLSALVNAVGRQASTASSLNILRAQVDVLRCARQSGALSSQHLDQYISAQQLSSSALHADSGLRSAALELVCASAQGAEPPSQLELSTLRSCLPGLLRMSSSGNGAKFAAFIHTLQRFLMRVKSSAERVMREKLRLHQYDIEHGNAPATESEMELPSDVQESVDFVHWVHSQIASSMYPWAPYERLCPSIEAYLAVVNLFFEDDDTITQSGVGRPAKRQQKSKKEQGTAEREQSSELIRLWGMQALISSHSSVRMLLHHANSQWERVRTLSCEVLARLPPTCIGSARISVGPTVGSADTGLDHHKLLLWGMHLAGQPNMHGSDAGAQLLRVLFRWLVVKERRRVPWEAAFHRVSGLSTSVAMPKWSYSQLGTVEEAVMDMLRQVHQCLAASVSHLRSLPPARRYFSSLGRVHGLVAFLRSVVVSLPWSQWCRGLAKGTAAGPSMAEWRACVQEVIDSLLALIAQSVQLHAEEIQSVEDIDSLVVALDSPSRRHLKLLFSAERDASVTLDCRGHVMLSPGSSTYGECDETVIVVSSWLAIKEACMCLGSWMTSGISVGGDFADGAPTDTNAFAGTADSAADAQDAASVGDAKQEKGSDAGLISAAVLAKIGSVILRILLSSKHKGVLEKTHDAFVSLNQALLGSHDPVLVSVAASWLEGMLNRVRAVPVAGAGGDTDSWIRRSAGLPYCVVAILKAEPPHQETRLLPHAMGVLLKCAQPHDNWRSRVHALNVLRSLFRDGVLAADILPWTSAVLQVTLETFNDPNWALRNSALMAFSAVTERALRERHSDTMQSLMAVRARGFFTAHPTLKQFLLQTLEAASMTPVAIDDSAVDASSEGTHPLLFPVLMLLSRLRPDPGERSVMGVFLPSITRCAGHASFLVRQMAAKAAAAAVSMPQVIPHAMGLLGALKSSNVDHNTRHGILLQAQSLLLWYGVERLGPMDWSRDKLLSESVMNEELSLLVEELLSHEDLAVSKCAPVRELFIQICSLFGGSNSLFRRQLVSWCFGALDEESNAVLYDVPLGLAQLRDSALEVGLSCCVFELCCVLGNGQSDSWLSQVEFPRFLDSIGSKLTRSRDDLLMLTPLAAALTPSALDALLACDRSVSSVSLDSLCASIVSVFDHASVIVSHDDVNVAISAMELLIRLVKRPSLFRVAPLSWRLWNSLVTIFSRSPHTTVRSAAIRAMASLLQTGFSAASEIATIECARAFSDIIHDTSTSRDAPMELREVALEALDQSHIWRESFLRSSAKGSKHDSNEWARLHLVCWRTAVLLLEAPYGPLRTAAANLVFSAGVSPELFVDCHALSTAFDWLVRHFAMRWESIDMLFSLLEMTQQKEAASTTYLGMNGNLEPYPADVDQAVLEPMHLQQLALNALEKCLHQQFSQENVSQAQRSACSRLYQSLVESMRVAEEVLALEERAGEPAPSGAELQHLQAMKVATALLSIWTANRSRLSAFVDVEQQHSVQQLAMAALAVSEESHGLQAPSRNAYVQLCRRICAPESSSDSGGRAWSSPLRLAAAAAVVVAGVAALAVWWRRRQEPARDARS